MLADYVWCQNCRTAIDPDELRKEYESWGETYYLCPHCGSDALVDAVECADCGELFDGTETGISICPECWNYRSSLVKKLNDIVKKNFSKEEIKVLVDEVGIGY